MNDDDIPAVERAVIDRHAAQIAAQLPDWHDLPPDVQTALRAIWRNTEPAAANPAA